MRVYLFRRCTLIDYAPKVFPQRYIGLSGLCDLRFLAQRCFGCIGLVLRSFAIWLVKFV
jgi:hypothetical protein